MITDEELAKIKGLPLREALRFYSEWWDHGWSAIAALGKRDRFFLLTFILGRMDACNPWIYARCREVEADPDDHLDLWAREHYKSTVITFAGAIQEILINPEVTIGIFSHNRPTAKKFLNQIKYEFETNESLKTAYPEICWQSPSKEAPRWSEDRGIILKRRGNPKEATVEAHGLVDGMPTGAHYHLRIYDDVVTADSVTTPEMIEKTTEMWRLSQNLGAEGGRVWYIGTRYHFNDTYRVMLDQKSAKPRVYPATEDGTTHGEPVLVSRDSLERKRRDQGPYVFSCQQLLNPVADASQGFKAEWLKYYDGSNGEGMNIYVVCDPASEKKKNSDYTVIWVIGLSSDNNYYVLDFYRDRLNLTERADLLFRMHKKWMPLAVGYEKYGKDSDIQHFQDRMRRENYRFHITQLGGRLKKEDRIRRLIPLFEQGRIYLPEYHFKDDYEGRKHDLTRVFVEQEYMGFPVATHDDMLDAMARIVDPDFPTRWPVEAIRRQAKRPDFYAPPSRKAGLSWMAT